MWTRGQCPWLQNFDKYHTRNEKAIQVCNLKVQSFMHGGSLPYNRIWWPLTMNWVRMGHDPSLGSRPGGPGGYENFTWSRLARATSQAEKKHRDRISDQRHCNQTQYRYQTYSFGLLGSSVQIKVLCIMFLSCRKTDHATRYWQCIVKVGTAFWRTSLLYGKADSDGWGIVLCDLRDG